MPAKKNFGSGGGSLMGLLGLGVYSLFSNITSKATQRHEEQMAEITKAKYAEQTRIMQQDFDKLDGYLYKDDLEEEIRKKAFRGSYTDQIRRQVDTLLKDVRYEGKPVDLDFFHRYMSGQYMRGAYRREAGHLLVMLMESQEGYVQREFAQMGYHSRLWGSSYDAWWDLTHQIMKIVDASLQACGKERMLFKARDDLYNRNIVPVGQVKEQADGTYFWHMGRLFI